MVYRVRNAPLGADTPVGDTPVIDVALVSLFGNFEYISHFALVFLLLTLNM